MTDAEHNLQFWRRMAEVERIEALAFARKTAVEFRVIEKLTYISICVAVLSTFCATAGLFTGWTWLYALALAFAGGWAFLLDECRANLTARYTEQQNEKH